MLKLVVIGICALAYILGAVAAEAVPVTWYFEGVVGGVGIDLNGGGIVNGQTMSGSFTFESTAANTTPGWSPQLATFSGAASSFSATFGSYTSTATSNGDIKIRTLTTGHNFELRDVAASGAAVNGFALDTMNFQLHDPTATALTPDVLPLAAPSLNDFTNNLSTTWMLLRFQGTNSQVRASFTSLTSDYSPIPEPGTLALLGMGLVVLGERRRRKGR